MSRKPLSVSPIADVPVTTLPLHNLLRTLQPSFVSLAGHIPTLLSGAALAEEDVPESQPTDASEDEEATQATPGPDNSASVAADCQAALETIVGCIGLLMAFRNHRDEDLWAALRETFTALSSGSDPEDEPQEDTQSCGLGPDLVRRTFRLLKRILESSSDFQTHARVISVMSLVLEAEVGPDSKFAHKFSKMAKAVRFYFVLS